MAHQKEHSKYGLPTSFGCSITYRTLNLNTSVRSIGCIETFNDSHSSESCEYRSHFPFHSQVSNIISTSKRPLFNELPEPLSICTHEAIHDFASLDEQKRRHRRHAVFLRRLGVIVHIDLDELCSGSHFLRQFLEKRGYHLAWTAPRRREVNHCQLMLQGGALDPRF